MENNFIRVRGARQHNLKSIDVDIPRGKFTVITGLSGSGKSSLAFDTIYAEGRRRYVESLSSYARQFLGQMEKPDVDSISGLSPAVSIDQKTTSRNPRSTVGTVTEIYDHLRLMFARIGIPHCPKCGRVIEQQTVDQIVDKITELPERTKLMLLSPIIRGKKGEYSKELRDLMKKGFTRVRIDGDIYELEEAPKLTKTKKHTIEVIVDRIIVRPDLQQRLSDSLETALNLSGGLVIVSRLDDGSEKLYSLNYTCPDCNISIEEMTPRLFSFNNPYGACPTCAGLGVLTKIDPDIIIPDRSLSLNQGAIKATGWNTTDSGSMAASYLRGLSEAYGFSLDTPVEQLSEDVVNKLFFGTNGEKIKISYDRPSGSGSFNVPFEGIITNLERRYRETESDASKSSFEELMASVPCPECSGQRLRREALSVTIGNKNIMDVCAMPIGAADIWLERLELTEKQMIIGRQLLRELHARLRFLINVGLDYLTLSRAASTLSGGEAQRIRLATQIGSGLTGVLYILDEPSIGLHQSDNAKLLDTLCGLRDMGNTLIVVEHDAETMLACDFLVDIGPGAGSQGGKVVAAGTPQEIMACPASLTGQYLSGRKCVPMPIKRRTPKGWISVKAARANNLKGINVNFPTGVFCCVTGVSGSGKSSLVNDILSTALTHELNRARKKATDFDEITGIEQLDKVIRIDQSPIGKSPRSNPATYTGLFDLIREVFAQTPDAKARGYKANRFSFNVKGGRCEACSGDGILKIEMQFLSDVYVPCEVCHGKRYNRETLEVRYKGKNIFDVLDMTVDEALSFFEALPKIRNKLQTMHDVGIGYVKLGQPSDTLSGGEAQRIKLATELSRSATGSTLYILDEPTTGLHMADVAQLNEVLHRLADSGNTLIIIEHNLDVIKTADYIIDLGPGGGDRGGTVVATGTPEEIAACPESATGMCLKKIL